MHELIHIMGICPDNISHLDLIDLAVGNYQYIADIKIKTIHFRTFVYYLFT
jgi:hypothetical protein